VVVRKTMASQSNNKKRGPAKLSNFLEALRNLGEGVVDSAVHDVAEGVAQTAADQLTGRKTGELKPNQTLDLEKATQEESGEKLPQAFQGEFLDLRRQEKLVYSQAEQETKLQIAAILDELKKLALSTKDLAQEMEVAAKQVPVEPGVYHLNFFEKLREAILLFKKRIQESTTWLAAFNQRAKRRSYYWRQVGKSGTKFMLSQERYMSTQAG